MSPHPVDDHDHGLERDLPMLLSRRRALAVLGASVGAALVGCGDDDGAGSAARTSATPTPSTSTSTGATTSTASTPEETAGPFPGDGSNGPNVLTESGVVREDIRKSFGDVSGTAEGVRTTLELTLIDVAGGGGVLKGAAVYLWHCTIDGRYSLYDQAVASENFLRGVQSSDANGRVTFKTIYPGAYAGRWPHMHFEVYESLEAAGAAGAKLRTSQVALPEDMCRTVYDTTAYAQSKSNFGQLSLDSDMVFADGYAGQLATASGSPANGVTLQLNVGV